MNGGKRMALVLAAILAVGPARAEVIEEDVAGLIAWDKTVFAVIDRIDGEKLELSALDSVMSGNRQTILFIGDKIEAILLPPKPDASYREACVTAIKGQEGSAKLVLGKEYHIGCPGYLGQVRDFRSSSRLSPDRIVEDTVVTVWLNGVIFEEKQ